MLGNVNLGEIGQLWGNLLEINKKYLAFGLIRFIIVLN